MAVLYGISGKATGKKGDTVFSVRKGQQIMRQYNPIVADPKTTKQTNARAKMKLLSQLSAIMVPILAIPGRGPVTPRNIFTKKNYSLVNFADSKAQLDLVKMQITDSSRAMVNFTADRTTNDAIRVELVENATEKFDRVVYALVKITDDQRIEVVGDTVVSDAQGNGTFPGELPYVEDSVVVLAYGMKDVTAKAKVTFSNIEGLTATQIAQLVTARSISVADATLTETRGCAMAEGATSASSADVVRFQLVINVTGNGTVTGAGSYTQGAEAVVVATPGADFVFAGWYEDGVLLSTVNPGTIDMDRARTIEARFVASGETPVRITVNATSAGNGTVSGGGSVEAGASVTLTATPAEGYRFVGWYVDAGLASSANPYTFTANENTDIEARFEIDQAPIVLTAPTINCPSQGTSATQVTITAGEDATIYYTVDGTTPTNASTQYSAAFNVNPGTTIKAIAYYGGQASAVSTKTYQLDDSGNGDTN